MSDIELTFDGSQIERQAAAANKALASIDASLANVERMTLAYNDATGKLERVLVGVNEANKKFIVTLNNLSSAVPTSKIELFNKSLTATERLALRAGKGVEQLSEGIKRLIAREEQRATALANRISVRGRAGADLTVAGPVSDEHTRLLAGERELADAKRRTLALVTYIRKQEESAARQRVAEGKLVVFEIKKQELAAQASAREQTKQASIASRLLVHQIREQEQAAINTRKEMADLGNTGDKSGKDVLLSWRSVARLFLVQALHQSIALLRRVLSDAGREAFEYSKKVAEIRTITGDTTESTVQWALALESISRSQPFKVLEVGEAAYQALSNQVIKTTADLGFVREAGELAILGVSDITTSVNALTSIINAYDLSLLRTTDISALLFKTIELGRTRLDQLEENLGRVTILSSKLGVSLEEQSAALATLTNQGLKDNVAKTLLVNIFNKLIRPSDKMRELFDELNVSSGEAAIATFGLAGFLNILFKKAQESGDALEYLGESAQRIRATIGLAGLQTDIFNKNLERLTDTTGEYREKLDEIESTTFVRLKQQFTDLNTLVVKTGQVMNNAALALSNIFGGLDNAVTALAATVGILGVSLVTSRLLTWIGRGIAGLNALRLSIFGVSAAATAAGAATSVAFPWVTAINLAVIALTTYLTYQATWSVRVQETIDEVSDAFRKLHDQFDKEGKRVLVEWVKNMDEASKHIAQSLHIVFTEMESVLKILSIDMKRAFEDLEKAADSFENAATDSIKGRIDGLKESVKGIGDEIRDLDRVINDATKDQQKDTEDIGKRRIKEGSIGKTDEAVAKEFEAAGFLEEAQRIFEKIAGDSNRTDQDRAKGLFDAVRLHRQITDELQKQLDFDKQREAAAIKKRIDLQLEQDRLAKAAELEEKRLEAVKDAVSGLKGIDLERLTEDATKSVDDSFIGTGTDRQLAINKELERLVAEQGRGQFKLLVDLGINNKAKQELEKEFEAFRTKLEREGRTKAERTNKDELRTSLLDDLNQLDARRKEGEEQLQQGRATMFENVDSIIRTYTALQTYIGDNPILPFISVGDPSGQVIFNEDPRYKLQQQLIKDLNEAQRLEREIADEQLRGRPNQEQLTELVKQRAEYLERIRKGVAQSGIDPNTALGGTNQDTVATASERITQAVARFNEALTLERKGRLTLVQSQEALEKVQKDLVAAGLDRDPLVTQEVNTLSIRALTERLGDTIGALATLQGVIESEKPGAPIPEKALGGLVHGPGGLDNVLTRLTAGEFVMNAKATRANLPVLQAMNNPQSFARGGRVQNINIGDITVTGGNTSQATARQIARDIKREISRGTLTL